LTHQIPPNLHFASPLAKQNEKNQNMKHKSSFVGETITFSVCNKPFKPLGIPSGRVKSREGLKEVTPTNTLPRMQCHKNHGFYSWASLKSQTPSSKF
jgi:hypothetical protein